MMGDVAKGLKSFKAGMADEDEQRRTDTTQRPAEPRQIPPQPPIDITPQAPRASDKVPPRDDTAL
jgi:sec-independent protein translocase protein TatA